VTRLPAKTEPETSFAANRKAVERDPASETGILTINVEPCPDPELILLTNTTPASALPRLSPPQLRRGALLDCDFLCKAPVPFNHHKKYCGLCVTPNNDCRWKQ
jgi:hypothetical protein